MNIDIDLILKLDSRVRVRLVVGSSWNKPDTVIVLLWSPLTVLLLLISDVFLGSDDICVDTEVGDVIIDWMALWWFE